MWTIHAPGVHVGVEGNGVCMLHVGYVGVEGSGVCMLHVGGVGIASARCVPGARSVPKTTSTPGRGVTRFLPSLH